MYYMSETNKNLQSDYDKDLQQLLTHRIPTKLETRLESQRHENLVYEMKEIWNRNRNHLKPLPTTHLTQNTQRSK